MRSFALIASIAAAAAMCPNACSGHGICGANAKCSCHQNFQAADCSLRSCPSTSAWADTADGTNQAHYYAECGNKGTCDRKSGECKCFDGYEGKGCRRSTCPESCSGHGTCEYLEELGGDFSDRRQGPGVKYQDVSCHSQNVDSCRSTKTDDGFAQIPAKHLLPTNVVARTAVAMHTHGFQYQLWDAGKIQGCKCDLGYEGADCATREVPRGDDPLTTVKAETMVQAIQISATMDPSTQFFIRFFDQYGGSWVTDTVNMFDAGTVPGDEVVAADVQRRLRELPNGVLSDIKIHGNPGFSSATNLCHRVHDGVQHISASTQSSDGRAHDSKGNTNFCEYTTLTTGLTVDDAKLDLLATFGNVPGQTGVQYLFEVDGSLQGPGSYPVSAGIVGDYSTSVVEVNDNGNLGNLSELSTCSDRGLDNGEGECECFDGFRGLACEEQEALV